MGHENSGEKGPNIKRRILGGTIGLFALAMLYAGNNSADWTQRVEPIRMPADAIALSDEQDISRRFKMKATDAASAFCGKVVRYFVFSNSIEKYVTEAKNGNIIVECDTAGMDIPIERIP